MTNSVRKFLRYWSGIDRLQNYEERERFRRGCRLLIEYKTPTLRAISPGQVVATTLSVDRAEKLTHQKCPHCGEYFPPT